MFVIQRVSIMKRPISLLIFLHISSITAYSQTQEHVHGIVCGALPKTGGSTNGLNPTNTVQNKDARNGGVFTPRGDIRVLVIMAGFEVYDKEDVDGYQVWPIIANDVPNSFPTMVQKTLVNGAYTMNSVFYRELGQFSNNATDKTLSNYYKQMSMGQLNMIGDVYPYYVQVPNTVIPTIPFEANEFTIATNYVMNQVIANTNFDLSRYDTRVNFPNYLHNRESTFANPAPDGLVDYVVVMYRIADAYASAYSTLNTIPPASLKIPDGQTIIAGMQSGTSGFIDYGFRNIFIHELGHELYGGSHSYGVNGVVTNKFSATKGYSMMNHDFGPSCANAYERYKLGWADNSTTNYVRFIDSPLDNGTYQLTDYITTGKSICIKVPTKDPAKFQRLWLEYHHKTSIFDERDSYSLNSLNQTIEGTKSGLFAYIEDSQCGLSNSEEHKLEEGNYLKMLSPLGAYDVEEIAPRGTWNAWGSIYGYFNKTRDNPLSFSSQQWFRRWPRTDFSGPTVINYSTLENGVNWSSQEGYYFLSELGKDSWGTGYEMAFQPGDEISFNTSSVPANFQEFNYNDHISKQIVLNGINVKFTNVTNGVATVLITVDDHIIRNNQRFTGHVMLPDHLQVSSLLPDFEIESCKELLLDASAVPNQTLKILSNKPTYLNDIVGLTQFYLDGFLRNKKDGYLTNKEGSVLAVNNRFVNEGFVHFSNDATLLLTANALLELGSRSSLIIENGSYFNFHDNAQLTIHPTAYLKIGDAVWSATKNPLLKSDYLPVGIPYVDYQKSDQQLIAKLGGDNIGLVPSSCTVDGTTTNFCNTTMTFYIRNEKLGSGSWSIIAPSNLSYSAVPNNQQGSEVTYNINSSLTSITVQFTSPNYPSPITKTFSINYNKIGNLGGLSCPCEFEPVACETTELGSRFSENNEVEQFSNDLIIYPNPVHNQATIKLPTDNQVLGWFLKDQTGKLVSSGRTALIDRSSIPKGFYFIDIQTTQGRSIKKVIFN